MGLKNIHVFFIAMAVALCVAFGAWSVWMYGGWGGWGYLVVAAASFAAALALTGYANWFLAKMKGWSDS